MALVSMKTESGEDYPCCCESNPYGYGLTICLSEEQVEALGLDKNPPKAGSVVTIRAMAMVRTVTQEADPAEEVAEGEDANDIDVTLSLQITDMEITPASSIGAASSMYPNSSMS